MNRTNHTYRRLSYSIALALMVGLAGPAAAETGGKHADHEEPKAGHEEKEAGHEDHQGHEEEEAGHEDHEGHEEEETGHEDHEGQGKKDSHQGHEEAGADAVHLTDEQLDPLTIRTAPAEPGSAESLLSLPATVSFNADRVAMIGPRVRAKLVRMNKGLGDPVSAGEVIAEMDSVALGQAKAAYLKARARFETARSNYERQKGLNAQQIASDATLVEARGRYREARADRDAAVETLRLYGLSREAIEAIDANSEQPLSRYSLTSPIDGVLQRRAVSPGQTVGPESTPIHVVDTETVWLEMDAFEKQIADLAVGQTVRLSLPALPEQGFQGRVDWISRELAADSRTLTVRAVIDNPDDLLRAGMFGTATVQTDGHPGALLVPVGAVQRFEDKPHVFVSGDEPGAFRAKPVTVGHESNGMIEVRSGIEAGQPVVVEGAFDLMSILTAGGRSAAHSH
ncbi:efflux RND transporter periplasmic adaptor subunit [Guyparkeria sp. SB14A]|uniref:efflux RND transporter periplasmic adaptor subunit n=1 Tax=Guyparkeria sp. SB14A TaxID=2571147 RepID=UPI0010AD7ADD|nr:efflux RND transporter periplasmic adaptor subunit [Guyparkeria sp. SB14A]TKA89158.1 efflux RND transporter periplasmic adaptor subunit [Guyparkeria sp. SB14A]